MTWCGILITISRRHWIHTWTCLCLRTRDPSHRRWMALSGIRETETFLELIKQCVIQESWVFDTQKFQTFFLARSWQPVKFSGNLQVPNSTVYARAKLAPVVANLFLSFSSCKKFKNDDHQLNFSVNHNRHMHDDVQHKMLTLLALLFSRYSSKILALAEEVAAVVVKTMAARDRRAALLPSAALAWSTVRDCWALMAGNFGVAMAVVGAEASFELRSEPAERT